MDTNGHEFLQVEMRLPKMKILCAILCLVLGHVACGLAESLPVREGDIIFQSTPSRQTRALEFATGSVYTHVGLIMKESGRWVVYEAIQPVVLTPLENWIQRGTHHHYVLKRWKNAEARLDAKALTSLRAALRPMVGRDYDGQFLWDDAKIYCSELVWKAYHRALGVELMPLEKYRQFDLSHPEVKKLLAERFQGPVPLDEPVIPPSSLFLSPLLVEVSRGGKELSKP
jgi:hypothetical protein